MYLVVLCLSCSMWGPLSSLWHACSLVAACEHLSGGLQHLVPWPGIEPGPPVLGAWSLIYWTTGEVPVTFCFKKKAFINFKIIN